MASDVTNSTDNPYDQSTDKSLQATPDGVDYGSGGSTLGLWQLPRKELLRTLGSGSFTNNSMYSVPSGVVDTGSYDTVFEDGEKITGLYVQGIITGPEGSLLPGTATILYGGEPVKSEQSPGSVSISSRPPESIIQGSSVSSSNVEFDYSPSLKSINYRTSLGLAGKTVDVEYGTLVGQVLDYDGNPLEGEELSGNGFGLTTDKNGEYEVYAPLGVTVEIEALGGSTVQSVSIGENSPYEFNFKYGKIEISVVGPDYKPIPNERVEIGDVQTDFQTGEGVIVNTAGYTTDENGVYVDKKAPIKEIGVIVQDYWEGVFEITQQGGEIVAKLGPDSFAFENPDGQTPSGVPIGAIDVTVKDGFSSGGVSGLPIRIEKSEGIFGGENVGFVSTGRDGKAKAIVEAFEGFENGTHTIYIGENDDRYVKAEYPTVVMDGDTEEISVDLDQKTQTVDF